MRAILDEGYIKRERAKARKLKKTSWWQKKVSRDRACYYCQKSLDIHTATLDHVVPLSRGGESTKGNIVLSCKACNTEKKNQTAFEMITL